MCIREFPIGSISRQRKEIPIPDKISVSIRSNIWLVNLVSHEPIGSNFYVGVDDASQAGEK